MSREDGSGCEWDELGGHSSEGLWSPMLIDSHEAEEQIVQSGTENEDGTIPALGQSCQQLVLAAREVM